MNAISPGAARKFSKCDANQFGSHGIYSLQRMAMLELARERPVLLAVEEFDRFNRQIHRYAALVEDAEEYAEHCQFLLQELRAQVEEETNRNLY